MKQLIKCFILLCSTIVVISCSTKEHEGFSGKFTDEFGNKFELHDDNTAVIMFVNTDPIVTKWSEKRKGGRTFATIEYNGNDAYYYLFDGVLYRQHENMLQGKLGISITWDE